MAVEIRPATRDDAQQIAEVMAEVRTDPYPTGLDDNIKSAADVQAWLERLGTAGTIVVADDGRQILAFASIQPALDENPEECQFGAWVRPRNRRQGHATALAEEALGFARERGYRRIKGLLPDANEPALSYLSAIGALVPFLDPGATFELPLTEDEEGA